MGTSFEEIKKAIDTVGSTFEEYKKANDARLEALKDGDESKAKEAAAKLDKIEKDLTEAVKAKEVGERELALMRERVEELEAAKSSPGKTAIEKINDEYKGAFLDWVRNRGQSPEAERKMTDLARKAKAEHKDVEIAAGATGGFAVPEEISRAIEKHELLFSPVRSLVKVVRVGTSDYKELLAINGATSGWVGETGTRSATAEPTLREIAPTHGELYAYPQASEWSLDDIFFNVENWLAESVGEAFSVAEATAVVSGDGTNKPTGMLNSAPTTETDADGTRSAAEYEFVPNVDAGLALDGDNLITLIYRLNSMYRAGATWVMNSNTTAAVRKLKDDQGQYHWQPGLQAGQPNMLLGYPVSTWEQFEDIGDGNHPIAFGNFRRGYVIADRTGLRITRDNVTTVGYVKFYVRRREGGIVLNNNAIKFLKTTTV